MMTCQIHFGQDAVGTCVECGHGICEECAVDAQGKLYCKKCSGDLASRAKSGYSQALGLGVQKSPGVAAVLSFFWTGLGQIYNGQIGKGVLFIIIQAINFLLMFVLIGFITAPLFWIWGMVDAYKTAESINEGALGRA